MLISKSNLENNLVDNEGNKPASERTSSMGSHEELRVLQEKMRDEQELEYWLKNDCIKIAKNNMLKFGFTEDYFSNIYLENDKLIKKSIEESKNASFPDYNEALNSNFNNTYHKVVKNFIQENTQGFELGQKESKLNPY